MEERAFHEGFQIFKEGDTPKDGVYLIKSGCVEITKKQPGKDVSIAILHDNAIFGEMALIDGEPRSATATALEKTVCYVLSPEEFEKRLKLNNIDMFMRGVFRVIVHTARDATQKYTNIEDNQKHHSS